MANHRGRKGLNILVLEPYYGGSHKSFLSGLGTLPFNFTFMTFPARKWKWRMRLSAPFYAQTLRERKGTFDRIICSTFVDVAVFRGLAPPWVNDVPLLTYFHENQFAYPVQSVDERDFHFALTNMTTALASDRLAFNSVYNLESFLHGIKALQKKSYDLQLDDPCNAIRAKSRVIPPGIDFSAIDSEERSSVNGPPVLLWNHRWEHDKNPDVFFRNLFELDRQGIDYKLIVLGESFKEHPPVFEKAREKLAHRVLRYGFVKSRREYARWLRRGDIIVSTAVHEFFGISVLEAVRAGCRPLLPNRLSYPEFFSREYLYDDRSFFRRLKDTIRRNERLPAATAGNFTKNFSWEALAPVYRDWIEATP